MTNKALEDSQKAIHALEAQIDQLKKDQGQSEAALRTRMNEEMDKKHEEEFLKSTNSKRKLPSYKKSSKNNDA